MVKRLAKRLVDLHPPHESALIRDATKALLSERDQLVAALLEIQREVATTEAFYPEATISGDGAVDPVQGKGEFDCPPRLVELCAADPAAAATPVCLLYSTDTVGGNSGSPVLDADGNFVAINFDRQRLGLMNEFKWSREYSRSIGTDVRYMLLLIGKYDGAQWLVDEMVGGASE